MDALKQFLSAERVMLGSRDKPGERWHVMTGPDESRILTTEELDEALARLDADRHPWGEPGKVPSAPGPAWYANGKWVLAVFICDDGIPRFNDDDEVLAVAPHGRFRRRWTPAPPTTEETDR